MLFQGLKTNMAVKNMNFTQYVKNYKKISPKALKNSFNKLDHASISARSAVIRLRYLEKSARMPLLDLTLNVISMS